MLLALVKWGINYLNTNKISLSYWKHLFYNNSMLILIYGGFMLLLLLLFVLYKVRLIIWWDLLRFSCIPVIFYFVFRVYRENKKIKNIHRLLAADKLPSVSKHNLTELSYIMEIKRLKTKHYQVIEKYKNQWQEHRDYLTNWSHEIKVPITDLLVLSENKGQVPAHQVRQQLTLIKQQLDLMLNYNRLADFNHDLRFNRIDLKDIINSIIRKYATFFINKEIHLELNIPDIKVLTDPKWLQALLEQVIFNSIKYSYQQGTIKICWSEPALKISDNGVGISSSDLPRIFEPGFTGMNGRENDTATGMGLYLAGQISHKLADKLEITSNLKQGTTVRLIFPSDQYH